MTAPPPDGPPTDPAYGAVPGPPVEPPFDPYRFGPPAHPIDPAYAPPGYIPPPPPVPDPPPYQPYGQAPYGQPYGQPPAYGQPPMYGQPPGYGYGAPQNPYGAPKVSNGLAVTALVLGIIALLFSWFAFFDGVIIIPAIVFGIVGISVAGKRGGVGRTMAIIGLCLALVAAAICIAFSIYIVKNCSFVYNGFSNSRTLVCNGQSED